MDGSTVREIKKIVEDGMIHEVDGEKWSKHELHPVVYDPLPRALEVASLSGVCDYLKYKADGLGADDVYLIVHDHEEVQVVSELNTETMNRKVYMTARASCPYLGERDFQQVEEFIIALLSRFQDTPDRTRLLSFLSKVTVGDEVTTEDNGVAQKVTVQKGTSGAVKRHQDVPSIVTLKPFRTFREIEEQPESKFLFRMKSASYGVSCALREADGNAWVIDAREKIKTYLESNIEGARILA